MVAIIGKNAVKKITCEIIFHEDKMISVGEIVQGHDNYLGTLETNVLFNQIFN